MSGYRYYRPEQDVKIKLENESPQKPPRSGIPSSPQNTQRDTKSASKPATKADRHQKEKTKAPSPGSHGMADLFVTYGFAAARGEISPKAQFLAARAILEVYQTHQKQLRESGQAPEVETWAEFREKRQQRQEDTFRLIREEAKERMKEATAAAEASSSTKMSRK